MLAIWLVAIAAFLVCATVYVEQLHREHPAHAAPVDPITPVTIIGIGAIFFAVLVTSTRGWRTTLPRASTPAAASDPGVVAACAHRSPSR